MRSFPLLDGYRAIAALMVLTTHVAFSTAAIFEPVIGPLLGRMDFGVTLFFLLSGFLLYRPWAAAAMDDTPGPRLGSYALRRAVRILPAYWLMLVVVLLLIEQRQAVPPPKWTEYALLLFIYSPDAHLVGLGQVWSLATEASFYIALPVIAWLLGRRYRGDASRSARYQLGLLAAVAAGSLLYTLLRLRGAFTDVYTPGYWLPAFLDWFAIGMACAVVSVRLERSAPPRWMARLRTLAQDTPTCLLAAGALFVIAATPLAGPLDLSPATPWSVVFKHLLYGVIAALFLLPGFLGRTDSAWGRFLTSPVVVFLGTVSYGVFLWHFAVIFELYERTPLEFFGGGFWFVWPVVVALSVLVATCSWFALERPLLRWVHRPRSAAANAAPARSTP